MKKTLLSATLAIALAFPAALPAASQAASPAQAPSAAPLGEASGAMDVVVLLDSSQSVLPYFQDVTDYLLSSVVRDFLRFGDTFHLISFGDSAQTEIAQRMTDERDVKSVLGRLYLLYPLARHSDFLGALGYLRQYLTDLPESRHKVVVIVTDGIQNPAPGSPSAAIKSEQVGPEIESACAAMRAKGWEIRLVRLPFVPASGSPAEAGGSGSAAAGAKAGSAAAPATAGGQAPGGAAATESGGSPYFDVAAKALGAPVADFSADGKETLARKSLALPSVRYPGPLGKRGYSFAFPLEVANGSDSTVGLELESLLLGNADILTKKAFLNLAPSKSGSLEVRVQLPADLEPGERKLEVEPRFAGGVRVDPPRGTLELTLKRSVFGSLLLSGATVLVFAALVLLGLGIAAAIFIVVRRLRKRTESPVVAAVLDSEPARRAVPASTAAASSPAAAASAAATPAQKAGRGKTEGAAARPLPASASESSRTLAASSAAAVPEPAVAKNAITVATNATTAAKGASPSPASAAATAPAGQHAAPAATVPAGRSQAPVVDEHEADIEKAAAEMARSSKEEASRAADLLSAAASRGSEESLARIAAFKAKREAAQRERSSEPAAAKAHASGSGSGIRVVKPGTIRVEMRVEGQNPNIGSRNVHTMHAGTSKTIGGGRSDFLVFLVPTERRAAELRFDGESVAFVPRRPELFPGTEGELEDCLDQEILMLGKGGYPLVLRFSRYELPADKINRLLHCIDTPGLVEG